MQKQLLALVPTHTIEALKSSLLTQCLEASTNIDVAKNKDPTRFEEDQHGPVCIRLPRFKSYFKHTTSFPISMLILDKLISFLKISLNDRLPQMHKQNSHTSLNPPQIQSKYAPNFNLNPSLKIMNDEC